MPKMILCTAYILCHAHVIISRKYMNDVVAYSANASQTVLPNYLIIDVASDILAPKPIMIYFLIIYQLFVSAINNTELSMISVS